MPAKLATPAKPNSRQPARQVGRASGGGKGTWQSDSKESPDPILFQTYFKSVGPRTYAAQLKRAKNGNQYLVLTEGKRDKVTEEVRKTRLYIYSEDFVGLFKLLKQTAEFIRANPVPADIARKRSQYWAKRQTSTGARPAAQA